MTIRVQLYIASYTAFAMVLLGVFSKPLHIPEAFQLVLSIGVFAPLGWMFFLIQRQKKEKNPSALSAAETVPAGTDQRKAAKKRLVLMMLIGSVIGLCSPFWLPLTGTSLGTETDLVCGIAGALVVCLVCGISLKKI